MPDHNAAKTETLTGAEIILKALVDQGVDVVFGYPGGAVLPIYDALHGQNSIRHILVRHEQGAVHAAEGYARSTGKVGVVLVTSGPGATNAVTGLTDALMDSIPVVCLTGQVARHLIGNDAFQECDTTGITRPCTKHNYLIRDVNVLSARIHEAFHICRSGRPGPVVIDLPKDVQMSAGTYTPPGDSPRHSYRPRRTPDAKAIEAAVALMAGARRPVLYTGGGIINAGPRAAELLQELVDVTGFPCTSTLMGLGGLPASHRSFLGMLGMHGTYEANLAMHGCDVMINLGARFDDRITGRLDAFSPNSRKIHADIDASSINKNVPVDIPIIGDCAEVLEAMLAEWRGRAYQVNRLALEDWWAQINLWRRRNCLSFAQDTHPGSVIKPQQAIQRIGELAGELAPGGRDTVYITTEVGQHQMWAAQFIPFEKPNRWMTSGGLGTMGYGVPAAIGVQLAHPEALVIDVAGEASFMMNVQELATMVQYRLPVKVAIINNQWMGMVRQWQELLHGERYSESYSEALPDFVALARAFGMTGLRAEGIEQLDDVIREMITTEGPVIADIRVDQRENCFPMIPGGNAHDQMLMGPDDKQDGSASEEGKVLV